MQCNTKKYWGLSIFLIVLSASILPLSAQALPEPYLIKDINLIPYGINPGSSHPKGFFAYGGKVYFLADDGTHGDELWVSDGTEAGTVLFKDINPGDNGSKPGVITEYSGKLYFLADDGTHGQELWVSDGTEAGAVLLKDINPGSNSSNPNDGFTEYSGKLYFSAHDDSHGQELWVSDGTEAGTMMLKDINPGSNGSVVPGYRYGFTEYSGKLYFSADDGTHGEELWVSDGTEAGTVLLKDINPGSRGSTAFWFTEYSGKLYFSAHDESQGQELWVSDGTEAGTVMLKDIYPGNSSNPADFTEVNGKLYFIADDGAHGNELWVSDGTGTGTVMVKDIQAGPGHGVYDGVKAYYKGLSYFLANDGIHGNDFGFELWVTDGTEAGTVMVKDLIPGTGGLYPSVDIVPYNGKLYFARSVSDGTAQGSMYGGEGWPILYTSSGTHIESGGRLYYAAQDEINGVELWTLSICGDGQLEPGEGCDQGSCAEGYACFRCTECVVADADNDGISADIDNCPATPNAATQGTCVKEVGGVLIGTGVICTDNATCAPVGVCQMHQEDMNANGIGDACECYADFNHDGNTMLSDLVILKSEFGRTNCSTPPVCQADANGDGAVILSDLIIMKDQFGRMGCPVP